MQCYSETTLQDVHNLVVSYGLVQVNRSQECLFFYIIGF